MKFLRASLLASLVLGSFVAQVQSAGIAPSAEMVRPTWNLPNSKYVRVLGHRIHYYEKGSGSVILLVHGFSGSAGFEFGRVFDLLAANHRVIALHQIGFAPSDKPDIRFDTAAFVDHLGAFMKALDLHDVTLVGASFGGWVVSAYAVKAGEKQSGLPRVKNLVLADAAIPLDPLNPNADPVHDQTVKPEVDQYLASHPFLDNEGTKATALQQTGLLKGEIGEQELQQIQVRTLVIWGANDELVPLSVGQKIARAIKGAQLVVIENSGHGPSIERPREFAKILAGFVDGH